MRRLLNALTTANRIWFDFVEFPTLRKYFLINLCATELGGFWWVGKIIAFEIKNIHNKNTYNIHTTDCVDGVE